MSYRNDYRRNVIFCGYDEIEKRSINICDASEICFNDDTPYKKCPHVLYLDTIEEALKHKGLALYLKVNKDIDLIAFDKKYRRKLDYWYIYIYNQDLKYKKISKYTNIDIIEEYRMFGSYDSGYEFDIDYYYEKHKHLNLHPKRKEILDKVHSYLRKKKEVSSKDLVNEFKISIRNIQRYMNDINRLYNDIGYDYSKNVWYVCD